MGPTDLVIWVRIRLGGRENPGVPDGATISIVAKYILRRGDLNNIMPTAAIRMVDGHVVYTCGDCEADVHTGSRSIAHRFYVMYTEAFNSFWGRTSSPSIPRFQPSRYKRAMSFIWTPVTYGNLSRWSSLSTCQAT